MVEAPTGIPEPVFTTSICIGCGACHYACPVLPIKAITVSGLAVHRTADLPPKRSAEAAGPGEAPAGERGSDFPF
jgi:ferredoxin